jgi:hypothetical protein
MSIADFVITDSGEICLVKSYRIVRKNIRNLCTWMALQSLYLYGEVTRYLNDITNEYISTPESPVDTPPVRVTRESSAFIGPNVDEHVISASITHLSTGESYDILELLQSLTGYPTAQDVISSYEVASFSPEEYGVDIITSSGNSRHFRNADVIDDMESGEEGGDAESESDEQGNLTQRIVKPTSESSLDSDSSNVSV